jgi:hypothetical protein
MKADNYVKAEQILKELQELCQRHDVTINGECGYLVCIDHAKDMPEYKTADDRNVVYILHIGPDTIEEG